jgi:hypothetical protein
MEMLVRAGQACQYLRDRLAYRLPVADVQVDEVWTFVGCKEGTKERKGYGEESGDAYYFTALYRETKMIVAWQAVPQGRTGVCREASAGHRWPVPAYQPTVTHRTRCRFRLFSAHAATLRNL